ncbi:MAG: IMPACT family protein [Balneolaceae bacterium]
MKTLHKNIDSSLRELGSKFLGFLFTCSGESEFKSHLEAIKKEFPDASHHCYAYRYNPSSPVEFSSDDGEPSGTAGLPILNQLKSFEVINIGVVVVRYFGGTKLGKPGLIQAYGDATKICLEKSTLLEIQLVQLFKITYPYSLENEIKKLIKNYTLEEQHAEYLEHVSKTFACPIELNTELETQLKSISHLPIQFEMLHKSYISAIN